MPARLSANPLPRESNAVASRRTRSRLAALALLLGALSPFAAAQGQTPTVSLSVSPNPVTEGNSATVTVTLSEALPNNARVFIPLTVGGGTAESGDYTADFGNRVRTRRGRTTVTGTITTNQDDDTDHETFTVALGTLPPEVTPGSTTSVTVTVTATLSAALPSRVFIPLTLTDGTAESGDYEADYNNNRVSIRAGQTSGTGTITTNQDDDTDNETFTVALGTLPPAVTRGSTTSVEVTISDDDGAPVLSISSPSVAEGDSGTADLAFVVTLAGSTSQQVTVAYADSGTGTATSGTDYTAVTAGTLTFAAGDTPKTVTVAVTGDTVDEPNETVVLRLSSPSNATLMGGVSELDGTGTITDDEAAPVLSISSPSVAEGDSGTANLAFVVSLTGSTSQQVTVAYADSGTGTATAGTDYRAVTAGTLTFAAGDTAKTVTVTVTADTVDEPNETVVLQLSSASNATLSGGATTLDGTGTITDDDATVPTVSLSVSPNPVTEGNSVTVTATLSAALPSRVFIPLTLTDGTAESGDYEADYNNNRVPVRAGQTSGTGTITTAQDDDTDNETFTVALGTLPPEVTPGGTTSVEVTITDDNVTVPTVSLSVSPNPVTEGNPVTVTATLSAALSSEVSIPVTLTDGTADRGDHGTLDSITISSGQASGTGTITTAQDDDTDNETFTVALGTLPPEVTRGSTTSVEVTITDDDATVPTVSLSVSPNPVTEGNSVTVTATLSAALPSRVFIPLTLTDGTAESGDYEADYNNNRVPVRAGQASGTGTVTTAQDDDTDNETFTVALGTLPPEVTPGSTTSVEVTITDDDVTVPTVSLSVSPNPVPEGSSVTVTAMLSATLASDVSIPVWLVDDTAEAGDRGALDSITISSGQASGTGTIATAQDDDIDDELFAVVLGEPPETVTPGSTTSVLITIADDDSAATEEPPQGPLQLALWTDQVAYRPGEPLRLYRTLEPHRLRDEYAVLFYRQCVDCVGPVRLTKARYFSPLSASDRFRGNPFDQFGLPEGSFRMSPLPGVERELSYQGPAPEEPGLWQFVMELRTKRGKVRRMWAKFVVGPGQLLTRRGFERVLTANLTLEGGRVHYLLDRMVVPSGATLRLEAGALVQAWGNRAEIVVEPGGLIEAAGTRQQPVVLTCLQPPGQRQPGCWGGLRLLGRAPVTGVAEGAPYGGSDWADSSGSVRYMRIEFAGASPADGSAAPALALSGIGSSTVLEHLQVRSGSGPGVAFIGGAVGCDYCVASANAGGGVTWQGGWRGRLRHLYVWQGRGTGDAIDGRNLAVSPDLEPRSHPELANVTLASGGPRAVMSKGCGLRLQDGTGLTAQRLLVCGFRGGAVVVGPRTGQLLEAGASSVTDSIQYDNLQAKQGWSGAGVEFLPSRSPRLHNAGTDHNHDPRPRGLLEVSGVSSGEADYVGAFGEQNWLEEWTVFGREQDYAP